jgi:hypothetical protein
VQLTGLHILGAAYQAELRALLRKLENLELQPYFDSASPPLVTIGIGVNIDDVPSNLAYVLEELLINGRPSEKDPTRTANQIFKSVMDSVPDGSPNNPALRKALDDALRIQFPYLAYSPVGRYGAIDGVVRVAGSGNDALGVNGPIDSRNLSNVFYGNSGDDIGNMKGVNVVPQLCKAEVGGNKEPFKILLRQAA